MVLEAMIASLLQVVLLISPVVAMAYTQKTAISLLREIKKATSPLMVVQFLLTLGTTLFKRLITLSLKKQIQKLQLALPLEQISILLIQEPLLIQAHRFSILR